MDIRVFVDTDEEQRMERRLQRDLNERGRSAKSVMQQFEKTVLPMHNQFVEPSKKHADMIIFGGFHDPSGIKELGIRVKKMLAPEIPKP